MLQGYLKELKTSVPVEANEETAKNELSTSEWLLLQGLTPNHA